MRGSLNRELYDPFDPRVEGLPGEQKADGSDVLWADGKRLCVAASENKVSLVQQLLAKKISPNATDTAGYTPLHYVARNGNLHMAVTLINAKANVNAAECSFPPLHRAAFMGHVGIATLLLQRCWRL